MLDGFLFLLHLPQQTFVPHQSVLSLLHAYDVILVNSTDGVLLEIGGEDRYGSKQISSIYGLHLDEKKRRHPSICMFTYWLSGGRLLMVEGALNRSR